jgi:hypothetical protein
VARLLRRPAAFLVALLPTTKGSQSEELTMSDIRLLNLEDPRSRMLPQEIRAGRAQWLAECQARFNDETKSLDERLQAALDLGGSHERSLQLIHLWSKGFFRGETVFLAKSILREWSSFDRIPHDEVRHIFDEVREHGIDFTPFLPAKDRAFYSALPRRRVTAYRGQDAEAAPGLSWTADREVAAAFARGHRGLWNPNPVILKAVIDKADIAFVCTGRNEAEIVLWDFAFVQEIESVPSATADG